MLYDPYNLEQIQISTDTSLYDLPQEFIDLVRSSQTFPEPTPPEVFARQAQQRRELARQRLADQELIRQSQEQGRQEQLDALRQQTLQSLAKQPEKQKEVVQTTKEKNPEGNFFGNLNKAAKQELAAQGRQYRATGNILKGDTEGLGTVAQEEYNATQDVPASQARFREALSLPSSGFLGWSNKVLNAIRKEPEGAVDSTLQFAIQAATEFVGPQIAGSALAIINPFLGKAGAVAGPSLVGGTLTLGRVGMETIISAAQKAGIDPANSPEFVKWLKSDKFEKDFGKAFAASFTDAGTLAVTLAASGMLGGIAGKALQQSQRIVPLTEEAAVNTLKQARLAKVGEIGVLGGGFATAGALTDLASGHAINEDSVFSNGMMALLALPGARKFIGGKKGEISQITPEIPTEPPKGTPKEGTAKQDLTEQEIEAAAREGLPERPEPVTQEQLDALKPWNEVDAAVAMQTVIEAEKGGIGEILKDEQERISAKTKSSDTAVEQLATPESTAIAESPTTTSPTTEVGAERAGAAVERAVGLASDGEVQQGNRGEISAGPADIGRIGESQEGIRQGLEGEPRSGESTRSAGRDSTTTPTEQGIPSIGAAGETGNVNKIETTKTNTLPETISEDIRAGTATADRALQALTKTDNKLTSALAHALRVALGNTHIPIEFREGMIDSKGRSVVGRFVQDANGSRILLDPVKGLRTDTLMHEIVHGATLEAITNPKTLEQRQAIKDLTRMMERAKTLTLDEHYGFTDLKEFVAEALSNRDFQDKLSKVKWEGDLGTKSLWQKFKEIIARTLSSLFPGKEKTVLYNAILRSVDLFEAPRRETTTKVELNQIEKQNIETTKAIDEKGPGEIIGYKEGIGTTHRAWKNEDGSYRLYDATPEHPEGINRRNISEEEVYKQIEAAGSIPENRTVKFGTAGNNRNSVARWKDGALVYTAIKHTNGKWYAQEGDNLAVPGGKRNLKQYDSKVEAVAAGDAVSKHESFQASQEDSFINERRDLLDVKGEKLTATPAIPSAVRNYLWDSDSPILFTASTLNHVMEQAGHPAPEGTNLHSTWTLKNSLATHYTQQAFERFAPTLKKIRETIRSNPWLADRKEGEDRFNKALSALHAEERIPKKLPSYERGGIRYIDDIKAKGETEQYKNAVKTFENAQKYLKDNGLDTGLLREQLLKIMGELKQFSDTTLDVEQQYGLKSAQEVARTKAFYQTYIPLKAEGRVKRGATATGQSGWGNDVVARILEQRAAAYKDGIDNAAINQMVLWAHVVDILNPDGTKIFKIEPVDREHTVFNPDTGETTVSTVVNPNKSIIYRQDGRPMRMELNGELGDQIRKALEKIKPDDRPQAIKIALGAAAFYTRMFSALHTSLSPRFGPKNFERDIWTNASQLYPKITYRSVADAMRSGAVWQGAARLGYHPAGKLFGKDTVGHYTDANIQKAIAQAKSDPSKLTGQQVAWLADRYQPLISMRHSFGADLLTSDFPTALRPSLYSRAAEYLAPADGRLTNILSGVTHTLENVNRLAVFIGGLKSGLHPEEAATAAKNSTTNFERQGTAKWLRRNYPFSNAKMQGMRTLSENLGFSPTKGIGTGGLKQGLIGLVGGKVPESANPRTVRSAPLTAARYVAGRTIRAAQLSFALGLLMSYANYKTSDKDKDGRTTYGKRSEFQLDEFMHIPGTNLDIPIPQELGAFYIMGSSLGDKFWGDRAGASSSPMVRFITAMVQNFNPMGTSMHDPVGPNAGGDYMARMVVPQYALPVYDVVANTTSFGNQVNSQKGSKTIPPEMQGATTSSLPANTLAQGMHKIGIDTSPKNIDHFLLSLFQQQKGTFNAITDGNVGALLGEVFKSFQQEPFKGQTKLDYETVNQEVKMNAAREAGSPLKKKQYTGLAREFANTDTQIDKLKILYNKTKDPEVQKRIDERQDDLRSKILKKYYEQTGVIQ